MNTKEYIIIEALNELDKSLGKHLDQTKSAIQVFSLDEEMVAQFRTEYANRVALRNYVRDLAEEIQSRSGTWIIDDSRTPENARLLETMEGL